jgi:uroporphyrinogen-III synthase
MASLNGKRVVITRPPHQAAALVEQIQERGGQPICIPVIEIAPLEDFTQLDQTLRQVQTYDWVVLTSVNGVNAVWERFEALGLRPLLEHVQVAAIGPKTAAALEQRGVTPDYVPDKYIAEAILPGLGDIRGQRILLLRADIARAALAQAIRAAGGLAEDVSAYRTRAAGIDPEAWEPIKAGVDIIIFTSASTVAHFVRMLGQQGLSAHRLPGDPLIACIGPVTAATAANHGLRVDIIPQAYTIEGLISALEACEIRGEVASA